MMSFAAPLRLNPFSWLFVRDPGDPADQARANLPTKTPEPEDLRSLILTGFNKDFRLLHFYRIHAEAGSAELEAFKGWLRTESKLAATEDEVVAFHRAFQATRVHRNREGAVEFTWLGIALSQKLLHRLAGGEAQFAVAAVTEEPATPSAAPSDPAVDDPVAAMNWLVAGDGKEADLFIILESDVHDDLMAESARLRDSIAALNSRQGAAPPIVEELTAS